MRPCGHNGYSNTHSLQAEVERRYSNGLAFQWFYTYAHSLTTSDTGGFNFGSSGINSSGSGSAFAVPENGLIWGAPNLSEDERLRLGYANSTEVSASTYALERASRSFRSEEAKIWPGHVQGLNLVFGGWQIRIYRRLAKRPVVRRQWGSVISSAIRRSIG